MPRRLWLSTRPRSSGIPTPLSRSDQKVTESAGASTTPSRIDAAKVTSATTAPRRSPRRTSQTTKTSGVSLTAAASPIATPRHRSQNAPRASSPAATSPTSTMLTWPRNSTNRTGSVSSTTGVAAASHRAGTGRPTARCIAAPTTGTSAADTTVSRVAASGIGTSASGTSSTAATGGYTNGRDSP